MHGHFQVYSTINKNSKRTHDYSQDWEIKKKAKFCIFLLLHVIVAGWTAVSGSIQDRSWQFFWCVSLLDVVMQSFPLSVLKALKCVPLITLIIRADIWVSLPFLQSDVIVSLYKKAFIFKHHPTCFFFFVFQVNTILLRVFTFFFTGWLFNLLFNFKITHV